MTIVAISPLSSSLLLICRLEARGIHRGKMSQSSPYETLSGETIIFSKMFLLKLLQFPKFLLGIALDKAVNINSEKFYTTEETDLVLLFVFFSTSIISFSFLNYSIIQVRFVCSF